MGLAHLRPPGAWGESEGTPPSPQVSLARPPCLLGTVQIAAGTLSVSNSSLSNGAHEARWRKRVWRRWGLLME